MLILTPHARLIASASGSGKYEILAIAVGPWHPSRKSPNGRPIYSTEESLRAAIPIFEGLPLAAVEIKPDLHDHIPDTVIKAARENGLLFLGNRVGRLSNARFDVVSDSEKGIVVTATISDPNINEVMYSAITAGRMDFDGFSIDGDALWEPIIIEGVTYDVPWITHGETLDFVKYPAAGGKVLRLAASQRLEDMKMNLTPKQLAILGALLRAAGVTGEMQSKIWTQGADVLKESSVALRLALKDKPEQLKSFDAAIVKIEKNEELDAQFTAFEKLTEELAKSPTASAADDVTAKAKADAEVADKAKADADAKAKAEAEKAQQDPAVKQANDLLQKVTEQEKKIEAMQTEAGEARIEQTVTASHLPDVTKTQLVQRLKASRTYDLTKIKGEIDAEAKYLQKLLGDQLVPMLRVTGSIELPRSEMDNLIFGMRAMLVGNDPNRLAALQKEAGNNPVKAFRSWREANNRITGSRYDEPLDRVFRKLTKLASGIGFQASDLVDLDTGRVTASTILTTDLASVFLVSMHNQFISDYKTPTQYDVWRKIAKVVSLKDLYTHYLTRAGWYQAASSVAEGGTYQETTTTPSDEHIGVTAVKYGHIFTFTEEMVINDQLGAVQRLQMQLSDGMKRDIHNQVFSPILDNAAVAYGADTDTLIHANHSNGAASSGASLLTADHDTIAAGWLAMINQTEYGSGMKLGDLNRPRYLICHTLGLARAVQLLRGDTAFQVATTSGEYGTGDILPAPGAINPFAALGIEPIVALGATASTDWWLLAEPNSTPAPAVVVGFLNGQEQPEIVTEPANTGSQFTADKIRIKVKNYRDVEPGDHRGIYGQIA